MKTNANTGARISFVLLELLFKLSNRERFPKYQETNDGRPMFAIDGFALSVDFDDGVSGSIRLSSPVCPDRILYLSKKPILGDEQISVIQDYYREHMQRSNAK